jgi:hypothetical protein
VERLCLGFNRAYFVDINLFLPEMHFLFPVAHSDGAIHGWPTGIEVHFETVLSTLGMQNNSRFLGHRMLTDSAIAKFNSHAWQLRSKFILAEGRLEIQDGVIHIETSAPPACSEQIPTTHLQILYDTKGIVELTVPACNCIFEDQLTSTFGSTPFPSIRTPFQL